MKKTVRAKNAAPHTHGQAERNSNNKSDVRKLLDRVTTFLRKESKLNVITLYYFPPGRNGLKC